MYRNKTKTIKQASKVTLEKHGGNLQSILAMPLEEARRKLMQIPGIGPKTADIRLLLCAQKPTFPIDTHINRVAKRLELALENGSYEAVRRNLQTLFGQEDYFAAHKLLIQLGKAYCKARITLCRECPVHRQCPSSTLS